jgi:hypothetical protein
MCLEQNVIERIVNTSTLLNQISQFGMFHMFAKIGLFIFCCFNFPFLEDKIAYDRTNLGGKKRRTLKDCNILAKL